MQSMLIILLVFACAQVSFGQLSGPLSGTLGPGTYTVVGDISVNSGNTLTLLPGTTFNFLGPYSFTINGTLFAEGTLSDSIVFTTNLSDTNRWLGLRFSGAGSSGSRLACCLIEKGYARGDWPNNWGGGVDCSQSSPTFTNCTLRSNSADFVGGGVNCYESSPTFTNCSISGNSANCEGGGIYCYDNSSPTFTNCTVSGNSADPLGGGVSCNWCSPTFTNCTISANSATHDGGGVRCNHSSASFTNCLLSSNSAGNYGGGVGCIDSSPTFTNCTFVSNSGSYAGGVYWGRSSPTFNNTIIAFSEGAGIYFYNSSSSQIEYCDIFGNSGGNIAFWNNDPSQGPLVLLC